MDTITALALLLVGLLVGTALGVLWAHRRTHRLDAGALADRAAEDAVLREGLARIGDQLRDLDHSRVSWQGQLAQQVADMRHSTDILRQETRSLSTALRKPQVRGRWGELTLRRVVELAGMVDRCDFTEQVPLDDGALRPDLVVHLAGGRQVVVDAKVPLDAFLDATSTDDEDLREHHLTRHVHQLRTHIDQLSSKRYWRSLRASPEFVVCFLPAEAFLSAGLEVRGDLLEYAAQRQVVLATPTTLIALLRTVAQGWTHAGLADRAQEIHDLGRELHERLGILNGHLDQLGRSLNTAVGHFNGAVGSYESRVLVTARRFDELAGRESTLATPQRVPASARDVPSRPSFGSRRGSDDGADDPPTLAL